MASEPRLNGFYSMTTLCWALNLLGGDDIDVHSALRRVLRVTEAQLSRRIAAAWDYGLISHGGVTPRLTAAGHALAE